MMKNRTVLKISSENFKINMEKMWNRQKIAKKFVQKWNYGETCWLNMLLSNVRFVLTQIQENELTPLESAQS